MLQTPSTLFRIWNGGRSPPPTHHETTFVTEDIWRAQRVPPAPRQVAFRVPDHEAAVEPVSSIPIDLAEGLSAEKSERTNDHTYIFFGQADQPVTRPYAPDEGELTPR